MKAHKVSFELASDGMVKVNFKIAKVKINLTKVNFKIAKVNFELVSDGNDNLKLI